MTPQDSDVRINTVPTMFDECDIVHVSVTFREDMGRSEWLAKQWEHVAPTKIGGPACGDKGEEFIPNKYIAKGNVITHRGCPNSCWFCDAWKKEGHEVREYPVQDGWNLLDNNIFACSKAHQQSVYEMLSRQERKVRFTGGLEAKRMTEWNAEWLEKIKPEYAYFAYDEPSDWEPLVEASKLLIRYDLFKGHSMGCYVLIGYNKDTFGAAEKRLVDVISLGFMPQAMLFNRGAGIKNLSDRKQWQRFQREWANKVIVGSKMGKMLNS